MTRSETVAVHLENDMKAINAFRVSNSGLLNAELGGICSYHCA
jgi:hypothetical protein